MSVNIGEWDTKMDETTDASALEKLYTDMKGELKKKPSDPEVLWRLTKACLLLSDSIDDKKRQKELIDEGLVSGKKSCEVNPKSALCHKWYCAAIGRVTKFCGSKEKIKYGQELKQHLDIALSLSPNDYLLHHMSGRFAYELSSLSRFERTIANTIFGSVPESSYDIALQELLACDQLKPNWKDNYLWIAKTYLAKKDNVNAKDWVNRGLALETKDKRDEEANKELTKLKSSHQF